MTVRDLQRLYDYGYWANARLLRVVAELTPDQFTQTVAGSYGSVRNTLVHVMSAEWGWLDRCGGFPRGPALKADDYPTFESVADAWRAVEAHVREFLSQLADSDLDRIVHFALPGSEPRDIPLGALMQHAANHAVHHRGQVALLLRMLGRTPGNVDLVVYDMEMRSAAV